MLEILFFFIGILIGFLIFLFVKSRMIKYDGTIFIKEEEQKIVYSLELNEDPESIGFKKRVVFKVDRS